MIRTELEELQILLADVDSQKKVKNGDLKVLIRKTQQIKLRMAPDKNHKRPHFHLDYNRTFRAASIAVDHWEILAGKIPFKYQQDIEQWVHKNKSKLLKIWNYLKESKEVKELVEELEED